MPRIRSLRSVLALIAAATLVAAVAATAAPTWRTQDACGPWTHPSDLEPVARKLSSDLARDFVPVVLASGARTSFGVVDEAVASPYCENEHQARMLLTFSVVALGLLCGAATTMRRQRQPRLEVNARI